jgi:uncharacterized protein
MSDGAATDKQDLIEASAPQPSPESAPQSPQEPLALEAFSSEDLVETNAATVREFELGRYRSDLHMFSRTAVSRTPNAGDAAIFLLMLLLGSLLAIGGLGLALHFRWFGLHSLTQAQNDTRLALGSQLLLYGIGFCGAVPFFRTVWGEGYFAGVHWHWATAYRLRYLLVITAFVCNVIAMVGNWLLPFPEHAPIDKMFGSASDAWMLMIFGVTVAPFFEEMIFRGFLLPATATAWDWCFERATQAQPRSLDAQGNPRWSLGAMVFAALVVSAPFALMHSAQVAKAWGPLSLLYCVSLILCAVRLWTRSLAASTMVHSAYNFMLFAMMLWQTDGFRHLDRM